MKLQRAHAKTLHAAGILSLAELTGIGCALDKIAHDCLDTPCPDSDAEDIHTWLEGRLVESAGDAGRKIHTARSRNDQVAALLVMYAIDAGERLAERFAAFSRICAEQGKKWSDLAFPLQTHAQFAAPGTVGFWALRYAVAFDRLREFTGLCLGHWRQFCPLGSGAVAGSLIPIDRRIQAAELGFREPSPNALLATSTRDECLQLLSIAAQAALHLQSLAADVIAFSQTPFAWTIYPGAFGTGSSMMPNKANPDAMELLRGESTAVLAAHAEAVLLLKGLPSGYNRDLQCIKPIVRDAVEKLLSLSDMATAFMGALDFDRDRLAASMDLGAIDATLRMEAKVRDGVALRDAHHAVVEELASAPGKSASATSPAGPPAGKGAQAPIFGPDRYQTLGSASPDETRRVADELLSKLRSAAAPTR